MTKQFSFRKKKPIRIGNILQNVFNKIPNCMQKGSVFMKKLHEKDIEFTTGFGKCNYLKKKKRKQHLFIIYSFYLDD